MELSKITTSLGHRTKSASRGAQSLIIFIIMSSLISMTWFAPNITQPVVAESQLSVSVVPSGNNQIASASRNIPLSEPLKPIFDGRSHNILARNSVNEGQWTTTDALAEGRYNHTATLLSDGRVLVVGGTQGGFNGVGLAGVEMYDPVTATWNSTGSLNNARNQHTATLLPDGRVLVVGGWNGSSTPEFASAEIYDPTNETWSYTDSLSVARRMHTATRLADGRVLVVGGYYDDQHGAVTTSAEIYDPVNDTWSATGSLNTPREGHSATLLTDGRVLVVGGYYTSWLASAEIYDPVSGTWSNIASPLACHGVTHTSTLLPDGRAMVVGGACGSGQPGIRDDVEIYDPVHSTWIAATSLSGVRSWQSATLLADGKVLVTGGGDGTSSGYYTSTVIYDITDSTWMPTGSLATGRVGHTATLLPDGRVLVAGGVTNGNVYLNSAEIYYATNPYGAPMLGGARELVYRFPVTNTGHTTDTFSVEVTGNAWSTVAPTSIGPLAMGSGTTISVTVKLPVITGTTMLPQSDVFTLTLTSGGDPAATSAISQTTVVEGKIAYVGFRIYLPLILRSYTMH